MQLLLGLVGIVLFGQSLRQPRPCKRENGVFSDSLFEELARLVV